MTATATKPTFTPEEFHAAFRDCKRELQAQRLPGQRGAVLTERRYDQWAATSSRLVPTAAEQRASANNSFSQAVRNAKHDPPGRQATEADLATVKHCVGLALAWAVQAGCSDGVHFSTGAYKGYRRQDPDAPSLAVIERVVGDS